MCYWRSLPKYTGDENLVFCFEMKLLTQFNPPVTYFPTCDFSISSKVTSRLPLVAIHMLLFLSAFCYCYMLLLLSIYCCFYILLFLSTFCTINILLFLHSVISVYTVLFLHSVISVYTVMFLHSVISIYTVLFLHAVYFSLHTAICLHAISPSDFMKSLVSQSYCNIYIPTRDNSFITLKHQANT